MLYAEYSEYKERIERLRGEKSEQTLASLSAIWRTGDEETRKIAQRLTEIGFFEQRGLRDNPRFWVPFIYRHYLDLVQGRAESTLV
jgi:hypothetical protein